MCVCVCVYIYIYRVIQKNLNPLIGLPLYYNSKQPLPVDHSLITHS